MTGTLRRQKASKPPSLKCSLLTVIPAKLERYQNHKSGWNHVESHIYCQENAKHEDPSKLIPLKQTEGLLLNPTTMARVYP